MILFLIPYLSHNLIDFSSISFDILLMVLHHRPAGAEDFFPGFRSRPQPGQINMGVTDQMNL